MTKYQPKTKAWFMERMKTGKRIYRDKTTCECGTCKMIFEDGLIVHDEQHAEYISLVDIDYANDGCFLNYRTEK